MTLLVRTSAFDSGRNNNVLVIQKENFKNLLRNYFCGSYLKPFIHDPIFNILFIYKA